MAGRYSQTRQGAGCGTNLFGGCGLAFGLVALLMVVGVAWLSANRDRIKHNAPASPPALELSVKTLVEEHLADEVAARSKYAKKVLIVTATVRTLDSAREPGSAYLTLTDAEGAPGQPIVAVFKPARAEEALGLEPGKRVRVKGRVLQSAVIKDNKERAVAILLTDCELLK